MKLLMHDEDCYQMRVPCVDCGHRRFDHSRQWCLVRDCDCQTSKARLGQFGLRTKGGRVVLAAEAGR